MARRDTSRREAHHVRLNAHTLFHPYFLIKIETAVNKIKMSSEKLKGSVGVHVDRREGLGIEASVRAAFAELPGSRCAQIFTHGPRGRSMTRFNTDDLRALCRAYRIYIHSTYPTTWKPEAFDHMQEQFTLADTLGAQGVVLHLVKQSPEAHIATLTRLKSKCLVILEMQAFRPARWTYQTAEEVNALCAALKAAGWGPDRAVICLDTAHIDAGRIALRSRADAERYITALRHPEYLGLLHLNGNAYNCMERAKDKHCVPFSAEDWIWHRSRDASAPAQLADSGVRYLVDWFTRRGRDVIMEQDFSSELVALHRELVQ